MAKKNFRAMMVKAYSAFFMVLTAVIIASCGKEPVDNAVTAGAYKVSSTSKPVTGEDYEFNSYAINGGAQLDGIWRLYEDAVAKDSAKASATIQAQVELEKAEIEINSSLKANNVWSFDSISQPTATVDGYRWVGYMSKNDGQKATFPISSTTAGLRDLVIGLEPVSLRADSTKNVAATPRSGERERMSTEEFFTATVRETGTGRSNTVDIPLSASYMRFIPENAPEIVDSIIDWTDDSALRSGLWALENTDKAQVKVIYLLSDGSRVDGPKYAKEAPRTLWGSQDKIYVSEFEKVIGANFSGSTSEGEATDAELSDENWTVSYETVVRSWEHEQKNIDGKPAVTSLFVKAPHFVFHHGALRHDFGKLPLDVANTSVEVVEKSPVVEDGKNYEVKQIRNTIDTNYGVDSTGIVAQQVISTVDLLKLNEAVVRDSTSAVMAQNWLSTQVDYTWSMTRWFSNNTQSHFDIKQAIARTIETNHWDATEFKKALTAGAARVKSQNKSAKKINGVTEDGTSYVINYTDVETTYEWDNTLYSGKVVKSTATTHNPENVRLTIDNRTFTQKGVTMKYNRGEAILGDAEYDDGSTQKYPYSCVLTESVEGYTQSALAKAATGTLTVNSAVPVRWELLSHVNEYFMFNHEMGAEYRLWYNDGSYQDFKFNKIVNGDSSATPVETTEESVSERVGVPSDYILRKEEKKEEYLSYSLFTTKVTESAERSTTGANEYAFTYTLAREGKYVRQFGDVVVEIEFEDPTISHNTETTDFVQTGEEETAEGTKYIWQRSNNLLVNINGQNNTIANYGVINIIGGHGGGEPEAPKAVIGGGIVSPKPGLSDNMYYVGYLIELNNGKVRPLIVDKNGQNVTLGDEFDKDDRWNGSAYINGTLYPVLGTNTGSMLKYTYQKGVSYAISAVNAGDGFNWNNATVNNVTKHYTPIIKKEGAKTILTLDGVANWSMSW